MAAMRYEPPEDAQEYKPQPRITWFSEHEVPDVQHHRALYLHVLNVTLENACESDAVDYPEIHHDSATWRVWIGVQRKVFEYWQSKRDADAKDVPRAHRYLMWHVWARMQFVLHRRSRRFKNAHTCELVTARRLRVASGTALQYSVADLWRAVHMLTTAWNTLRYSDQLRDYVSVLATQCGRYFWVALPTRRTFDHPSFVATVGNVADLGVSGGAAAAATHYCVNEKFTVETERLFFRLLGELHEHESLVERALHVHTAPRATSYDEICAWIRRASEVGAVREFVASDFAEIVYDRRALPGEVERFSERDQHADATAYNAIAQLRPEVIDQMAEMIEKEDLIEVLMDRVKLWGDDEHRERLAGRSAAAAAATSESGESMWSAADLQLEAEADVDAADIAITAAGYLLDDAFLSDHVRFATWFVCQAPPIPGAKRNYPVVVRACHAWHVAYQDELWLCDNAADAIECWIRALCGSAEAFADIHHVAPRKDPFFAAHHKLTGGIRSDADVAERAARKQARRGADAIMVPLAYEDEGEYSDESDE